MIWLSSNQPRTHLILVSIVLNQREYSLVFNSMNQASINNATTNHTALPDSVLRSRQISMFMEKRDVFHAFNEMFAAEQKASAGSTLVSFYSQRILILFF